MLPTEPLLRHLTPDDASGCLALATRVKWSQDVATWERCIRWSGANALGLALGDRLIATNLVLRYSERLAWVGMVITDPDFQGRGHAGKLMATALQQLAPQPTTAVMLDASTLGFPVYQKIGFRSLYPMEVYEAAAVPVAPALDAEPMEADDLPQIIALDTGHMGISRPDVIRALAQSVWVTRENGAVSGYLLAQHDHRGIHLGPWYHPSPEGAHDLLRAALNAFAGQAVRLQIPQPNEHAIGFARQYGWHRNRVATRMVLGAEPPGHMAEQYGIAGFPTG